jgi:hypothetical protein
VPFDAAGLGLPRRVAIQDSSEAVAHVNCIGISRASSRGLQVRGSAKAYGGPHGYLFLLRNSADIFLKRTAKADPIRG